MYVRPYLEPATIKTGRIYFHAHKSSLAELKCVFNKSTKTWELHPLVHRENLSSMYIDYKCDPYISNDEEHSRRSKSLDSYNEKKQKNNRLETDSTNHTNLLAPHIRAALAN